MGALSGNHEIVEVRGKYDSEPHISRKALKQDVKMASKMYSIEDDINKLFESIDIRNSRRGVGQHGELDRYASSKSAMKRPMRVGSPQVSGIGISEPVSLKQALRGLCISQASEMAAIRKRMSRPSSSQGFSETDAVKSLYRAVVLEAGEPSLPMNEGKRSLVEISLVPEKGSSNASEKAPEYASESESLHNGTLGSANSTFREKLPVFDEEVPISGEGSITEITHNTENGDSLNPPSSSLVFSAQNNPTKTSKRGLGSSKQSLKTQNFLKKKLVSSKTAKSRSQHHEGPNNSYNSERLGVVCQTLGSIQEKGCEEPDKESSITASVALDSNPTKTGFVPDVLSGTERVVTNERSRDQTEISQSSKSSNQDHSSTSYSEDSYASGSSRSGYRPHMSRDLRWEAISSVQKQNGSLGLRHFKLLRKLGGGDIGSVYLSELIGTRCLFGVKVMDNEFLASKQKMMRAQTEKEILEMLDHPFLPTLFAYFTTVKYSCFVMEYCPGGDLHVLRQKQPTKSFSEQAARFYVSEVLLALEYLHMLGVVYRDLKPENILVREDGHIMLSDFDLSLRCSANPMLLNSASVDNPPKKMSSPCSGSSCIDPFCLQPSWQLSCFTPRFLSTAAKTKKLNSELTSQVIPLPQLVVEPTSARSNSFVGTHEYLAPEIIKGEGHGSAVDWWTFGIFLYELLYGKTPFKGSSNEDTISNVVSQPLKFPECPIVSSQARDLIKRLLKKEPENRLGSEKGAAEIKQHPFFEGLNWALIRCEKPPEMPRFFDLENVGISEVSPQRKCNKSQFEFEAKGDEVEFEMF